MSKFNFGLDQYNLCLLEDEGRKEKEKYPKEGLLFTNKNISM